MIISLRRYVLLIAGLALWAALVLATYTVVGALVFAHALGAL